MDEKLKNIKNELVEAIFTNTDFIKADEKLKPVIDQLIDQEDVPADIVMKVLFEQMFQVADRYINSDKNDERDAETLNPCITTDIFKNNSSLFRRFNSAYAFMASAQMRINDFLERCDTISGR